LIYKHHLQKKHQSEGVVFKFNTSVTDIEDRDKQKTIENNPCHHFRKFPRTQAGKLFFDSIFQVELQKAGQYHIHYKNLRIELGKKRLDDMARTMYNSIEK